MTTSGPCCARADRCARRTPQRDNDGNPTGAWAGADLADGDVVWCRTCSTRLRLALTELPQLVSGVSRLVVKYPSFEIHYRTVDVTGSRGDVEAPMPIDTTADALVRLIVWETEAWAEIVATDAGHDWDPAAAARQPVYGRVLDATRTLNHALDDWLSCGIRTYPARSLMVNRADNARGDRHAPLAHTLVMLDLDEGEIYTRRDGPAAAELILELARRARNADPAGRRADDPKAPCRACGRRGTLRRLHHLGVVRCSRPDCNDSQSDGAYDEFVRTSLTARGLAC